MSESQLQRYLINNNDEFIKRYLNKIAHIDKYGGKKNKIKFLGAEVYTGKGQKRADLVYEVETLYPTIIVIELKQKADTNAITQLCGYIKDLKNSHILETENPQSYFGRPYYYYGIVVGKWVNDSAKRLIENDISGCLSYIDFSGNEFKKLGEDDSRWYEDQTYWFEEKMFS